MSSQERTPETRAVLSSFDEPEPLKSILPRPLSALIGRQDDIQLCAGLLTDRRARLLTLTGPGGVGKTRLALAIAHDAADRFSHGVIFVSLADVTLADDVLPTIARAIGARDESDGTAFERLSARLESLRALVVLDNLEQVLTVSPQLAELLQACPNLSLLVTSRVPLRVRGEVEHQVMPLSLPDPGRPSSPESLSGSESVSLFVQSVQGYNPRYGITRENGSIIADICRRLDGLPLAIELAASRLRTLSPEMLLGMLDRRLTVLSHGPSDLPERQRTLRNAISWSYDLLPPGEQTLFRAAATFSGGFDLASIRAITGLDEIEVTDGVERLLDHHLLRRLDTLTGTPRYWMLETIREFGQDAAEHEGETEQLQANHAAHFMAFSAVAAPHLIEPDQLEWLDRLEFDHENLRSALAWLVEHDPPGAARMVYELWRFWWARGYVREGRAIADQLLARRADLPPYEQALLLYTAGELDHCLSDMGSARSLLDEAGALFRTLDRPDLLAASLNARGIVARDQGELRDAQILHEEALELAENTGTTRQVANGLNNLAAVAYYLGDGEVACAHWQRAVDIMRDSGDLRAYSMLIGNLGVIEGVLGNLDRAIALKEESLRIARELRDPEATLTAIASLSGLLHEVGQDDTAEALLKEALPQTRESGDARIRATMLHTLGVITGNRGDHDEAARHFAESLLLLARSGQMLGVATDMEGLARTASNVGLHEDAVRMFAAAHAIRERTGAVRESLADRERDDELVASRAAFHRSRADELWQEGSLWTLDDVVAVALGFPDRVPDAMSPSPGNDNGRSRKPHPFDLTDREFEILGYLVRHHTDREIGDALFISPRTVTTHVASIINKLGVATRREAARMADEHRLLEHPS